MPQLIQPIVNINGTSRNELTDTRRAAIEAVQAAKVALKAIKPHGRDYPGALDKYESDRREYEARYMGLDDLEAALIAEALELMEF